MLSAPRRLVLKDNNIPQHNIPDQSKPERKTHPDGEGANQPDEERKNSDSNSQQDISVVFVDKDSKELSFLSDEASLNTDSVSQALEQMVSSEEDFGVLQEYGLIY